MSGRGGRGAGHQLCPSGFPVRPDPQEKELHIRKETGNNLLRLVLLYVHDRVCIESRKAVSSYSWNKARWVQESLRGADEPPTQKSLRVLLSGEWLGPAHGAPSYGLAEALAQTRASVLKLRLGLAVRSGLQPVAPINIIIFFLLR